jgi:hypothetical protein
VERNRQTLDPEIGEALIALSYLIYNPDRMSAWYELHNATPSRKKGGNSIRIAAGLGYFFTKRAVSENRALTDAEKSQIRESLEYAIYLRQGKNSRADAKQLRLLAENPEVMFELYAFVQARD